MTTAFLTHIYVVMPHNRSTYQIQPLKIQASYPIYTKLPNMKNSPFHLKNQKYPTMTTTNVVLFLCFVFFFYGIYLFFFNFFTCLVYRVSD